MPRSQRVLDNTSFILGEEVKRSRRRSPTTSARERRRRRRLRHVRPPAGARGLRRRARRRGHHHGPHVHRHAPSRSRIVGATPVFVDIDPTTFNIDPERVEARDHAADEGDHAGAPLRPAGRHGRAPATSPSGTASSSIEDAAQAHGARYRGQACGTIGTIGLLQLLPGQEPGRVRRRRRGDRATTPTCSRASASCATTAGRASTSTTRSATASASTRSRPRSSAPSCPHLADWTEARRRTRGATTRFWAGAGSRRRTEDPLDEHVFHLYVLRSDRRDELLAHLNAAGVGAGIHYPVPLHRQPAYRELAPVSLPHTERAAERGPVPAVVPRADRGAAVVRGGPGLPIRVVTTNVALVGLGYWGPNLARNLADPRQRATTHAVRRAADRLAARRAPVPGTRLTGDFDSVLADRRRRRRRPRHAGRDPFRPGEAGPSARAST